MFVRGGIDGARLGDIADHAGVSTGAPAAPKGASVVSEDGAAGMRHLLRRLSIVVTAVAVSGSAFAQQPSPDAPSPPAAEKEARSPWLLVPMFSSESEARHRRRRTRRLHARVRSGKPRLAFRR